MMALNHTDFESLLQKIPVLTAYNSTSDPGDHSEDTAA
jgi:hypothetical protein